MQYKLAALSEESGVATSLPPTHQKTAHTNDIFFVIAFATLWAWMEVEIEGKHGWAQKLPTACDFMGCT